MASEAETHYAPHFQMLHRRIACRRAMTREMAWLFDGNNSLPVVPDYLEFRTVGRRTMERYINRFLYRISSGLWFRLFWPRIRDGLLDYIKTVYFPVFFNTSDQSSRIREAQLIALGTVETFLQQRWDELGYCTFYEVGILVNEVLKECYCRQDCPEDLFADEKQRQNQIALEALYQFAKDIPKQPDILGILVYGACHANWIDILEDNATQHLQTLVDHYARIMSDSTAEDMLPGDTPYYQIDRIKTLLAGDSKYILFECDNCGEVAFDLLLIQYLVGTGHYVVLGAKERPALNDATVRDVESLLTEPLFAPLKSAMTDGRFSLLSIPSVMGGKLLYEASDAYKHAYQKADLLILKGQGNFQTLPMGIRRRGGFVPYRYKKPMVFLLPVKSVMSKLCLHSILTSHPKDGSLFLYYYDPADPTTYPQ